MDVLKSESHENLAHTIDQENDTIISSGPHKVNTQYHNGVGPQQLSSDPVYASRTNK